MRNAGLEEAQAGIKIAGRNINKLRKWRRTKEPLDESEREGWKSWFKTQHSENEDHGIQSHHIMENSGETVETVTDFILGGLQNHCRWWL